MAFRCCKINVIVYVIKITFLLGPVWGHYEFKKQWVHQPQLEQLLNFQCYMSHL